MHAKDEVMSRTRYGLPGLCVLLAMAMLPCAPGASAVAAEPTVLQGQVSDVDGRAVEGARVFAYDDADVRRPANFISGTTDAKGSFRMTLVPGKYWLVARLKKGEEYGPLMPGDKHSGEPMVLDIASGRETSANFTVADLREARKLHARDRERPLKITGRIIDVSGAPVAKAYAVAHGSSTIEGIPDYLSAWVDAEGRYTMFVPPGTYFIGSASVFPPGRNYFLQGKITADSDRAGLDIIVTTSNHR